MPCWHGRARVGTRSACPSSSPSGPPRERVTAQQGHWQAGSAQGPPSFPRPPFWPQAGRLALDSRPNPSGSGPQLLWPPPLSPGVQDVGSSPTLPRPLAYRMTLGRRGQGAQLW